MSETDLAKELGNILARWRRGEISDATAMCDIAQMDNRRAALDRPTDAEREELATWLLGRIDEDDNESDVGEKTRRIAALLHQPAPVQAVSEAMEDYVTHHGDWVKACTIARGAAASQDDRDYWQHQINTLAKLAAAGVQGKEGE